MKIDRPGRLGLNSNTVTHLLAVSMLGGVAPTVFGQEDQAQTAGILLEEIVVTATRREQSLQDVPVAVSVLSGEALETLDIRDAMQLSDYIPAYTVRSFNVQTPEIMIRGIGSQTLDDVTDDPSVGFFVDDVYMARGSAQKSALFDVQRLEVLRGPQGTSFGRNTMGGLVNVITNSPTEQFESRVQLSLGDYNLVRVRGMLNVPLVPDRLFGRFVAVSDQRDGYQKNVFDQAIFDAQAAIDPRISMNDLRMTNDGNEADDLYWRAKLRAVVTDDFELEFSIDSERTRPGALLPGYYVRQPWSYRWERGQVPPELTHLVDGFYHGLGPVAPTAFQHRPFTPSIAVPDDLRTSHFGQSGHQELNHSGFSLRGTLAMDNADLILIGSSRALDSLAMEDFDASYGDYAFETNMEQSDTMSLEARLVSHADGDWSLGGRLLWVAGVYYFEEDTGKRIDFSCVLCRASREVSEQVGTESLGVFAEASYDVTDRLSLTFGVRNTNEDKSALLGNVGHIRINIGDTVTYPDAAACLAAVQADPTLLGLTSIDLDEVILGNTVRTWLRGRMFSNPRWGGRCNQDTAGGLVAYDNLAVSTSDSHTTMKAAAAYDVADGVTAYFNYSEGFKSSVFTGQANSPTNALQIFEPERVNLYEFGTKLQDEDGRFRASAAMFYNDYTDFKQPKFGFDTTGEAGVFAGKADEAEIYGFELDFSAVFWDRLVLTYSVTRLDARLHSFSAQDGTKISSADIVRIPEGSSHGSLQYNFPETSLGAFSVRLDHVWEGDSINSVPLSTPAEEGRVGPAWLGGNGGDRVAAWSRYDAQLQYVSPTGTWDGSAWIRNVGDELYYTRSSLNWIDPEAVINGHWQEPRTVGVTVSYHFE